MTTALPYEFGGDSLVACLELDDGEMVALKIYATEGAAEREQSAYGWLGDHDLPLPQVIDTAPCSEEWRFGATLTTIAPGAPFADALDAATDAETLDVYEAVGGFMRELHSHAVPADAGSNADFVANRFRMLLDEFVSLGGGRTTASRIDKFTARYERLLDETDGPAICHGDLHPQNLRVDCVAGRLTFVGAIDLGESFVGDPTMDLVRTAFASPLENEATFTALIAGYDATPTAFHALKPLYFLLYELRLWTYEAAKGRRDRLRPIKLRIESILQTDLGSLSTHASSRPAYLSATDARPPTASTGTGKKNARGRGVFARAFSPY